MRNIGLIVLCALFTFVGIPASAADLDEYSAELQEKFSNVRTLATKDLAAMAENARPVLLDVRAEKEFAVSHLASAVRAETDGAAQLIRLGVSKDSAVVVYCSVGYRSARMARALQEAGFTNVRNLEGSIFAWANEGRPLVNANGPATGVHPFNLLWGRYLDTERWQWKPEGHDGQ